jgi:hypothetical protein
MQSHGFGGDIDVDIAGRELKMVVRKRGMLSGHVLALTERAGKWVSMHYDHSIMDKAYMDAVEALREIGTYGQELATLLKEAFDKAVT